MLGVTRGAGIVELPAFAGKKSGAMKPFFFFLFLVEDVVRDMEVQKTCTYSTNVHTGLFLFVT